MALAKCIVATRHNKVGDILELGEDHPFILAGTFEFIKPTGKTPHKKIEKKIRRRR